MRAAASLTSHARARAGEASGAMVTPGTVRDKMAVWICWLVLNWRSFSRDQSGIVQSEGSPPAALRAFVFLSLIQRMCFSL